MNIDIKNIFVNTAKRIIYIYNNQNNNKGINKWNDSKLLFPAYREEKYKLRISEQEPRVLMCSELDKLSNYCYALETPTFLKYGDFSKKGIEPKLYSDDKHGSGSIDLSIYEKNYILERPIPYLNIEFKFGTSDLKEFKKDFLKLFFEKPNGAFFHVYHKANANAINSFLTEKINPAIEYVRTYSLNKIPKKSLYFFLVVLERLDKNVNNWFEPIDIISKNIKFDKVKNEFNYQC